MREHCRLVVGCEIELDRDRGKLLDGERRCLFDFERQRIFDAERDHVDERCFTGESPLIGVETAGLGRSGRAIIER